MHYNQNMNYDYDIIHRIVLAGPSGVGKSSLLRKYADNVFQESFLPTIGVDFKIRYLDIKGHKVKLQFWDTAGQERFKSITGTYYRGAGTIVLVFDLTDRQSLSKIPSLVDQIRNKSNTQQVNFVLVGNKSDLYEQRAVDYDEAHRMAEALGLTYVEASAKSGQNLAKIFESVAEKAVNSYNWQAKKKNESVIKIKKEDLEKPQRGCLERLLSMLRL